MILSCNSCQKKFVVPDQAITAAGRTVQCGSCGNKWKQFPVGEIKQAQPPSRTQKIVSKPPKIQKPKKTKKISIKKSREVNLYSPEYLEKKHGIKLDEDTKKNSPPAESFFWILQFLVIIFNDNYYYIKRVVLFSRFHNTENTIYRILYKLFFRKY